MYLLRPEKRLCLIFLFPLINDNNLAKFVNTKNMLTDERDKIRLEIEKLLHNNFDVHHSSIQFECGVCEKVELIKN